MRLLKSCIICFFLLSAALVGHAQIAITTVPLSATPTDEDGQIQVKKNFSHRDLPPLNLDYFEISTQTGGDFYFWADGEFGSEAASQVIAESVLATKTMVYEYGDLSGKRSIPFSIGEHQYHYTIFVGIQSKDRIEIIQPDGRPLSMDEEGVKLHVFAHMLIATLNAPQPGEWTIKIIGQGKYLISVRK